ncbi:mediator complex subunit kohtalo isoform X2 [Oratosquilla oratoria]|uniref:mediator complex subunit kohtalo isoform X2 n=1 Tax=Oratosquilla oratoria TaxID=337810 RepID=UPI003F76EE6D
MMMPVAVPPAEHRHLKRQRLGPPDVYPQDAKQREDELDDVSVKQGFTQKTQIQDEYGTAKNLTFHSAKIASYFNAILMKKSDSNQLPDTGRKKQQINIKDNFWHVTPRSKSALEAWFKDLAGSKPLTSLVKKVPIFSKKEDMFLTLWDYSVPMLRATWFIKMTSAYHESKVAESKIKKRQQPDIAQEWTQTITRLLREQFNKISELYTGTATSSSTPSSATPSGTTQLTGSSSTSTSGSTSSSLPTTTPPPQSSPHSQGISGSSSGIMGPNSTQSPTHPPVAQVLKMWNYCLQLAHFMYQDGLLDRQEFLEWVLDLFIRCRAMDDNMVRVVLPLLLQYLDEFVQSEYLSRKLAYYSALKLSQLCADSGTTSPRSQSPVLNNTSNGLSGNTTNTTAPTINPLATTFQELLACHQHRPIVLALSCFIQALTLDCPTALVWNNVGGSKTSSWLTGSPLDLLPCSPSVLPMPPRCNNQQLRAQLRVMEEHIKQRSRAAENRWSQDKFSQSPATAPNSATAGSTINCLLAALDALDRHCFDRVDSNNSLDSLYAKIFSTNKEGGSDSSTLLHIPLQNTNNSEEAIVRTMCEWAVSVQRSGDHRALVVARLLEKRQNDLTSTESDIPDEKDSVASNQMVSSGAPVFQNLLLKFLDAQAPVLDENSLMSKRQEFGNLVLLFSELIRQDVFSHDAYMCTLISRGDLSSGAPALRGELSMTEKKEDGADSFEADLNKIIQNITKVADAPDSPKDDVMNTSLEEQQARERGNEGRHRPPRHLVYTQHFPLPQDDAYTHEMNQRYVLLYGVGKARDEARHAVKKLTKEIMKLFSKKFSIDIAEGGKVKKSSKGEFNFEAMLSRFCALSYFDQHVVTNGVASQVLEMLSGCGTGSFNHLPTHDHIAFLMDLMEVALNIHALIEFCIQITKEMPDIEAQLVERQCLAASYCPTLTLYVVGVLRKYHCCLLVSQEQTTAVFEGLGKLVKDVNNPSDCSSSERVVLAHLYDLYTSCSFFKSKHCEPFSNGYPKIKQTLYANINPAQGTYRWSPQFMEEYIKSPKLKIDPGIVKQLSDPTNRYSFVCSAIIDACSAPTNEILNDMAILCAELTACCNALSAEWLGVLQSLTVCSTESKPSYMEVLGQVDLRDPHNCHTIHNSLAVFTSILIARHCFTLRDFVRHVVVPSLIAAWSKGKGNPEAEPGARLTCHLLLRIFKGVEMPHPSQYAAASPQGVSTSLSQRSIRLSCDRHLLAAAHTSISVAPVLAVLKAMLIVSDIPTGQNKNQASISDILGTSDMAGASNDSDMMGKGVDKASLADFARYALRQICSQDWVRERCLKIPEELCSADNLLDSILTKSQAQRLLHQICHPDAPNQPSDASMDEQTRISNILEDLDEWGLRISWLDLHLMYKQHQESNHDLQLWLDNVAKAAIGVFHLNHDDDQLQKPRKQKPQSIWLVAPLISKLPKDVQGRVLRNAGHVLDTVNFGAYSGSSSSSSTNTRQPPQPPQPPQQPQVSQQSSLPVGHTSLVSHRPFLQLVLMCLEGQDDQLSDLLGSLHTQLTQFLLLNKDEKTGPPEDGRGRQLMLEALGLRFSLLGGLFDVITSTYSSSTITEWALLLVQLIIFGVIDLTNNSELFNTVLDMLATLIHSTLVSEGTSESREENKRHYYNLVKKIKKEIGERSSVTLRLVRQLIPLPKVQAEVITLEPWGSVTDTKGNRLQEFDKDKKHGLQAAEKQKLSPWDLLDGHRNPAPLSWAWFGATRLERKPLKYEEAHRLLRFHEHSMSKPLSYYLEPPPLPPEDLEPVPDKQVAEIFIKEEVKAPDTPTSDQSPRGGTKRGAKSTRRRTRQPRQMPVPSMNNSTMQNMGYQNPGFSGPSQNPWGNYGQQPPQQTTYYTQQPLPPGGPRFQTPMSHSKVAIRQMLGQRHPQQSFMTTQPTHQNFSNIPSGPMPGMPPRGTGNMIRQVRNSGIQNTQQAMYNSAGAMQSGTMPHAMAAQGGQMYGTMAGTAPGGPGVPTPAAGPGQPGMSQYGSYQQGGPVAGAQMIPQGPAGPAGPGGPGGPGGPTGPGGPAGPGGPGGPGAAGGAAMMSQGYQQGYQATPNMINMRQQQPGYMTSMTQSMSQGQIVQRPQYIQAPGAGPGMGMMGNSQGYTRPGMQTLVPTGGQGLGPGQPMGPGAQMPSATGMMRQRMIMGGAPGTAAQGGPGAPGQGGTLLSHLQRPHGAVQQQQQQQQQMMHPNTQAMGYPQPPPY